MKKINTMLLQSSKNDVSKLPYHIKDAEVYTTINSNKKVLLSLIMNPKNIDTNTNNNFGKLQDGTLYTRVPCFKSGIFSFIEHFKIHTATLMKGKNLAGCEYLRTINRLADQKYDKLSDQVVNGFYDTSRLIRIVSKFQKNEQDNYLKNIYELILIYGEVFDFLADENQISDGCEIYNSCECMKKDFELYCSKFSNKDKDGDILIKFSKEYINCINTLIAEMKKHYELTNY